MRWQRFGRLASKVQQLTSGTGHLAIVSSVSIVAIVSKISSVSTHGSNTGRRGRSLAERRGCDKNQGSITRLTKTHVGRWTTCIHVRKYFQWSSTPGQHTYVPQLDGVVSGPARQEVLVGEEGEGGDRARVPLQRRHARARLGVPQLDGLVIRPARQEVLVGEKGEGVVEPVRVPLQRRHARARLGVRRPVATTSNP